MTPANPTDTLYAFEVDLTPSVLMVNTTVTPMVERVTVHQDSPRAYLAKTDDSWCWEDLRDYVANQIAARSGVFPRDARKEYGIFTSFVSRWGIERAVAIARYAFETMDGRWRGAPISMTRFCKNGDQYFAQPIAEYLAQHT